MIVLMIILTDKFYSGNILIENNIIMFSFTPFIVKLSQRLTDFLLSATSGFLTLYYHFSVDVVMRGTNDWPMRVIKRILLLVCMYCIYCTIHVHIYTDSDTNCKYLHQFHNDNINLKYILRLSP